MDNSVSENQCNIIDNNMSATNINATNQVKNSNIKENLTLLTSTSKPSQTDGISSPQSEDHVEKYDISPENSNKKSTDLSPSSEFDQIAAGQCPKAASKIDIYYENLCSKQPKMNKSISLQIIENKQEEIEDNGDDSELQNKLKNQGLAFTIDFGDRKSVDTQRHKNMLERFQNRHRRGVSLSKLEESSPTNRAKTPSSAKFTRKQLSSTGSNTDNSLEPIESPQNHPPVITLRDKTNQIRDASKRHSWSPRSSVLEPTSPALFKSSQNKQKMIDIANIPCVQPPLEKSFTANDDEVSEAGTYTLDGDNYTEEQKEKMNIDKLQSQQKSATAIKKQINRPNNFEKDLEIIDLDEPQVPTSSVSNIRKNILEVSYCHESMNLKPKVSYLEKLKSRVKNISDRTIYRSSSRSPTRPTYYADPELKSPDIGTFTCITTSGVLSIKPTLEQNPKLKRKNSLTKSQIDSSEYVQGISRINIDSVVGNKFTDVEKKQMSEYQLNVFSQSQEIKNPNFATCTKSRMVQSVEYRKSDGGDSGSTTSILTAATKDDWIQEWAKNAREYSKHSRRPWNFAGQSQVSPMTRSYNFENCTDNQINFNLNSGETTKTEYHKSLEEFDNSNIMVGVKTSPVSNNFNRDRISRTISPQNARKFLKELENEKYLNIKPPMSPSKIPSPIHSIGRARGLTRSSYGSETDLMNDTEMYLHKTAAAISTLQNLQRRNSLRNNSLNNSPVSPLSPSQYTPTGSTQKMAFPKNVMQSKKDPRMISFHKRNASLDNNDITSRFNQMTYSLNSDHLGRAIASNDKTHTRHSSFEGMSSLPPRPNYQQHIDQTLHIDDDSCCDDVIIITERNKYSVAKQHAKPLKEPFDSTASDSKYLGAFKKVKNNVKMTNNNNNNTNNNSSNKITCNSPIVRSNSFNIKAMEAQNQNSLKETQHFNKFSQKSKNPIQKSISSTSFKKMFLKQEQFGDDISYDYDSDNNNDENLEFYINEGDDLNPNYDYDCSNSDLSDEEFVNLTVKEQDIQQQEAPITNTRYNKTFLMRVERSKKAAAGVKSGGAMACPNTPELPRREDSANKQRCSMPRDSSLSRLKRDTTPSLASKDNKKSVSVSDNKDKKVLPKYLDISKYKSNKGQTFLKKDESKSYLTSREIKKSSSSACLQSVSTSMVNQFQRVDTTRSSSRSVKSAGSRPNSSTKKDPVKIMKEAELLMWKRRASYDPMKAAAEGKKKQEEAKRQAQQQIKSLQK